MCSIRPETALKEAVSANVGQSLSHRSATNVASVTTDIRTVAHAIAIGMVRETTSAKSVEDSALASTTMLETTATAAQRDFTISPNAYVRFHFFVLVLLGVLFE